MQFSATPAKALCWNIWTEISNRKSSFTDVYIVAYTNGQILHCGHLNKWNHEIIHLMKMAKNSIKLEVIASQSLRSDWQFHISFRNEYEKHCTNCFQMYWNAQENEQCELHGGPEAKKQCNDIICNNIRFVDSGHMRQLNRQQNNNSSSRRRTTPTIDQ